ncbi:MAG: 5-(carboxyamino)imidazole ribonucleotide mutase [Enterobacteriaceae bacterium]
MSDASISSAQVTVIMGSRSDWSVMRGACELLTELAIPHEQRIVSAHRTPDLMFQFAEQAAERGIRVMIAGAGGAAHLPGMVAAKSQLPVIGVPIGSSALQGWDALLSIVQMPAGVPVATMAVGLAGARNAALLAAQILALQDPALLNRLQQRRADITADVIADAEIETDFEINREISRHE